MDIFEVVDKEEVIVLEYLICIFDFDNKEWRRVLKDCEIEREMDSGDLERQLILVSFISGIKFFELIYSTTLIYETINCI